MPSTRWLAQLRRPFHLPRPRGGPSKPQLRVEDLEPRDVPSASVATPDYILEHHSGTATAYGTTGPTGLSPAAIRQAYGFNQVSFGSTAGTGAGTTIAIVDAYDDPSIASDLHAFDQQYGLADPSFTKVNQTGGSSPPAANAGWAGEISLDVEWAHAIAPAANILLVEANSSSLTDLLTGVDYAAKQPGVVAVSMS
jgi:subtilase family serine protease